MQHCLDIVAGLPSKGASFHLDYRAFHHLSHVQSASVSGITYSSLKWACLSTPHSASIWLAAVATTGLHGQFQTPCFPAARHLQGGLSHRAVRGEARTDRDSVVLALTSDLGSSADVMPSSSGGGGERLKVAKLGSGRMQSSQVL